MTPWTITHQAPLSMGFSRQEYWSGLSFPLPGDLPHPGIKPGSPALQADFFFFFFNHLSHQGSHPPTPSQMELLLKAVQEGTSPVVQWLRLHAPKAGGLSSIPDQGTRFHMLQPKIPYAVTEIDQRCRVPQLSLGAAK